MCVNPGDDRPEHARKTMSGSYLSRIHSLTPLLYVLYVQLILSRWILTYLDALSSLLHVSSLLYVAHLVKLPARWRTALRLRLPLDLARLKS